MSANSNPSHISAYYIALTLSCSHSRPSETLKFYLWWLFTIKDYIQVLTSVSVWWRALLGGSCSGRGCGVAACLWHSGWISEQPSVWQGFAPLPVILMIWRTCIVLQWAVVQQCTTHPSSRGEPDVPLAIQSHRVASRAKGVKYDQPHPDLIYKQWLWRKVRCTTVKAAQCSKLSDSMLPSACALILTPLAALDLFYDAQACSLAILCCLCCCSSVVSCCLQWSGRANVM